MTRLSVTRPPPGHLGGRVTSGPAWQVSRGLATLWDREAFRCLHGVCLFLGSLGRDQQVYSGTFQDVWAQLRRSRVPGWVSARDCAT